MPYKRSSKRRSNKKRSCCKRGGQGTGSISQESKIIKTQKSVEKYIHKKKPSISDTQKFLDDLKHKKQRQENIQKRNKSGGRRKSSKKRTSSKSWSSWILSKKRSRDRRNPKRTSDASKRPSPPFSATLFKPNIILRGNDGKPWYVKKASNGVHRWVRA